MRAASAGSPGSRLSNEIWLRCKKLSMACIAPSRLGPIRRICGTGGCDAAFLSISIRSSAAAATVAEICGAMATSVWNTFASSLMTRDGSTARMLAGSGVLSVIGISPAISPGSRIAITVSTPLMTFVSSTLPLTMANRARAPPSWSVYSPGSTRMSSTALARYLSSLSPSVEKSGILASSSTVIMAF